MRYIKIFRIGYSGYEFRYNTENYTFTSSDSLFYIWSKDQSINPVYPAFIGSFNHFYIKIGE